MHGQKQNIRIVGKLLLQAGQEAGGLALVVQQHGAAHAELAGEAPGIFIGGLGGGFLQQRDGLGAAPRQRQLHGPFSERGLGLAPRRRLGAKQRRKRQ